MAVVVSSVGCRNEAGRLAEENLLLRHKISVLKEEDLRETREETL